MSKIEFALVVIILLLSLLLRISSLNVFITCDEPTWALRSINFRAALTGGDLVKTYQSEHPGVITMWVGTVMLPLASAGDLSCLLFKARHLVALLSWFNVIAIYLLVRKLFDSKVALFSAVLVAIDPFYLAHSRLFHLDAIVTGFMTISVLSLLAYLTCRSRRYLLLSGAAAGLAALNKAPALFLGPFALLLVATWNQLQRERPLRSIKELLILGIVTGLVVFALWPALWVDPVGVSQKVLGAALRYAEKPPKNFNFFLGEARADPGPWFYPVAWLFRAAP